MNVTLSLIDIIELKLKEYTRYYGNPYTVGIGLYNLSTNQKLIINNRQFSAASVIKIFIMLTAYKLVENKKLKLNSTITYNKTLLIPDSPFLENIQDNKRISIKKLIEYMIIKSDNTATNMLIDLLSIESINQFIISLGLKDTILQRKMLDFEAMKSGKDNWTTPAEIVEVLALLLNGKIFNSKYTKSILNILCAQQDREKIPALLPPEIKVANKPGELECVRNDVGIIFAPFGTYILAIFCDHLINTENIDNWMAELSRAIYDYFECVT